MSAATLPLNDVAQTTGDAPAHVNHNVRQWVEQCVTLCKPDQIYWCDGSETEKHRLLKRGVDEGVFIRLNQEKLPNCYLHRSNPNDVARSEHLTFICTPGEDMAGPTNNWMEPKKAYALMRGLFEGCMRGRTLYVIPFVMGPIGSPLAKVGVQVTDSVYVAVSMGIMTRMGDVAWKQLADRDDFTRCFHSVGDVNPERRYICHFPTDNAILSFGSGYGGNALLGKKCLALRIASFLGQQQGWMAEHMLLMGTTSPAGEKTYVAAAFPSACGKTNFAMLIPPDKYREEGWKISTVGDDIVWMWVDDETCRLRAINPENGYFGVVPGTNWQTNPNAMQCMTHDTLFTNVALLPDGDVWWEGKTDEPPKECIDWTGQPWTPESGRKAAHPNSRFTAPMENNPALDPAAKDPNGVPVSAIIFGGRRTRTVPLVFQAFNWVHGVYLAPPSAQKPPPPPPVKPASSAAIQWPCSLSLATTFAITWSTGFACAAKCATARASSTSTGSARTIKADSSGPATAKTCASLSGSSTAHTAAHMPRKRRSAGCHAPKTSTSKA